MDLKVGDKAIIVNSKHHSKYNFQKCTVESINRDKVFVTVFGENYSSEFWLKRNELIPLIYENSNRQIQGDFPELHLFETKKRISAQKKRGGL